MCSITLDEFVDPHRVFVVQSTAILLNAIANNVDMKLAEKATESFTPMHGKPFILSVKIEGVANHSTFLRINVSHKRVDEISEFLKEHSMDETKPTKVDFRDFFQKGPGFEWETVQEYSDSFLFEFPLNKIPELTEHEQRTLDDAYLDKYMDPVIQVQNDAKDVIEQITK